MFPMEAVQRSNLSNQIFARDSLLGILHCFSLSLVLEHRLERFTLPLFFLSQSRLSCPRSNVAHVLDVFCNVTL
jgi:hypothetical protein